MKNLLRIIDRPIMVQESRFRIVTANGQAFLFSTSQAAGVDEMDLLDLYRANIQITVESQGEPDLNEIVHSLRPLRAGLTSG